MVYIYSIICTWMSIAFNVDYLVYIQHFFWVICARTNPFCLHKLKYTNTHLRMPLHHWFKIIHILHVWLVFGSFVFGCSRLSLKCVYVRVCLCTFFCEQSLFNYIFIVAPVSQQKRPYICARQSFIHSISQRASYSQPTNPLHTQYTHITIHITS